MYDAGFQAFVEWQVEQLPVKLLPWDDGFAWHDEHAVEASVKWLLVWHFWQAAPTCAPVSLKCVWLWLNVAGFQAFVEWQVEDRKSVV